MFMNEGENPIYSPFSRLLNCRNKTKEKWRICEEGYRVENHRCIECDGNVQQVRKKELVYLVKYIS